MTTGGGIEAKRPSFIVSLHNVMERYVQRHSKTLARHQVRFLRKRSLHADVRVSTMLGYVLLLYVRVGFSYFLHVVSTSDVSYCGSKVRQGVCV